MPEVADAPALRPGPGAVVFDAVRFAYPQDAPVLHEVSFGAAAGQTIALVGATRVGKSTAMALLQRLWDPDQGTVRIDRQNISGVSRDSLRAAIGLEFQGSPVLNRSAALRLAQAEKFVLAMPEGLVTVVGERGGNLSGGQRVGCGDRGRSGGRTSRPDAGSHQLYYRASAFDGAGGL
ncbi:MAG: ATP-binding cassette domain-containing protein [Acetobacteraceae bacterium]|nr:ATP-binding cassette domain-containing protein [Acetobacteraceae bacterium]